MLQHPSSRLQRHQTNRSYEIQQLEDRRLLVVDLTQPDVAADEAAELVPSALVPDVTCALASTLTVPTDSRSPDLNRDGWVDAADAEVLFGSWGQTGSADLNVDGVIDAADAGILFASWNADGVEPHRMEGSVSSPFPLVSHLEQIPVSEQGRSAQFQQWFSPQSLSGITTLTSLRFYLDTDVSLPPNDFDLTFAVELRVSQGPATAAAISNLFQGNFQGPVTKVFDSFVTVAGHPSANRLADRTWIDLAFSTPVTINPALGGWMIDLTIRGMFGGALNLTWDAVPSGPSSVALFAADDRLTPFGQFVPNVPLVEFQVIPGAEIDTHVAEHCLNAIPLNPLDRLQLATDLQALHLAGSHNDLTLLSSTINQFKEDVDQLARVGHINTATAELLHRLGREEAIAVAGGIAAIEQELAPFGLHLELGLPLFDLTWLNLERVAATGLPLDDPRTPPLLAWAELTDGHLGNAFATAKEGTIDDPELKKAYDDLCKLIEQAKQDKTGSAEVIKILEDFKTILADPATLVRAFESLAKIIKDGDLDIHDLDDLTSLKEALKSIREKISADGILGKALDQIIRILCQLGAALDSGDLVSISTSTVGGKTFIRFDVNSEIEIRLLELLDLDTQSWYGKTDIGIDLHIKKDAVITLCPDGDDSHGVPKLKITFTPPDAIDLDIDSSGVWVVHVLEDLLGIPDLDQFCFSEIRFEDGKTVIEGTSGGKPVKITISSAGVSIEVDGTKVFPK